MPAEQEAHVGEKRHASPGPPAPPTSVSVVQQSDDNGVDYRALYFQEAEKNKQLLQWIVQLQSNLSMRLQMKEARPATDDAAAQGEGGQTAAAAAANAVSIRASESIKAAQEAGRSGSQNKAAPAGVRDADLQHHRQRQCRNRQHADAALAAADDSKAHRGASELTGDREVSTGAHAPGHAGSLNGRDPELSGADMSRIVSRTVSSSKSSSASPSLSHRSSAPQPVGQENAMTPEIAHVDLARTTCNKCGQGFAFCAGFLSRHEFLVMPCPKCRAAAAIPPTPLAPAPSASSARPASWQDGSSHIVGVSRGGSS